MTPTQNSTVSTVEAAVERYLSGYKQLLDFIEVGGANSGPVVEQILRHVYLEKGQPWCMAAAQYVGYRAFMAINPKTRERKSPWPLLRSGSCAEVAADAQKRGVLVTKPQRGDLFVLYEASLQRFGHTGVIDQVLGSTCLTIEGNTTEEAGDPYQPKRPANAQQDEREGWGMFCKHRTFGPKDRFIRWSQLMTL
jgi:hypothetical protein